MLKINHIVDKSRSGKQKYDFLEATQLSSKGEKS